MTDPQTPNQEYFSGILLIKGQIYGCQKDKYRYLFQPFDKDQPPLLVYSKINRTREPGQIICQVKKQEHKKKEKYQSGTLTIKIGSTSVREDLLKGLVYHYSLQDLTKKIGQVEYSTPLISEKSESLTDYVIGSGWCEKIVDHTDMDICSIDPPGCEDIDDAFCYQDGRLYIYIALVGDLYEQLNTFLDTRPFTFYFSQTTRFDMLGSETTSRRSLNVGQERLALTLQLDLDNKSGEHHFYLARIVNKRQLTYDMVDKAYDKKDKYWTTLFKMTERLKDCIRQDVKMDSHGLIETFMILYNKLGISKIIENAGNPVLRVHNMHSSEHQDSDSLVADPNPSDLAFLKFLGAEAATYQYTTNNHDDSKFHAGLGLTNYGHLTSPLRRAVDLYNQYYLLQSIFPVNKTTDLIRLDLNVINNRERSLKQYYRRTRLINISEKYSSPYVTTIIPYEVVDDETRYIYYCYWPKEQIRVKVAYLKTPETVTRTDITLLQSLKVKLAIVFINGLPRVRVEI